jgi:RNA polymerase sigma-70 factor (ECF subfamily)
MADRDDSCHPRDVIASAQNGNADAFHTLYRTTAPRLLNYLRSLVGDNDAEDVASEAWASIATDLRSFRSDRGDFRSWATAIARHRAADHLRKTRRAIPLPTDQLPHEPAPQDTERDAVEAIATTSTLALIAELPREQATAVLLRVVVGLDATAAGRILRKHPGAIRTATHRGLRTLAGQIEFDEAS